MDVQSYVQSTFIKQLLCARQFQNTRMNDMFWKDFCRTKNDTTPLTAAGFSKDTYSFFWILGRDYISKIKLLSLGDHGTSPNTIIMIIRSGFKTEKKIYVRRHFCIQNEGRGEKEVWESIRYSISLKKEMHKDKYFKIPRDIYSNLYPVSIIHSKIYTVNLGLVLYDFT